jgi:hypothetical protein
MWGLLLTVLEDSGKKGELTRKWVFFSIAPSHWNMINLVNKIAWLYFLAGVVSSTSATCRQQHLVMDKHFMTFWRYIFAFNVLTRSMTSAVFTVYSPLCRSAFAKKLNFHQLYSDISALSLDDRLELYVWETPSTSFGNNWKIQGWVSCPFIYWFYGQHTHAG